MKQLFKEDINNLTFDKIIVGVPDYVEIDQHKDILFMLKDITIYYNNECSPNSLTIKDKNDFKFGSYKYYEFNDMTEFCEWYLNKKVTEVNNKIENPEKITRGERLKEVRDYVKQVLNIEYYKNYGVFHSTDDKATLALSNYMVNKLKQQLIE